MQADGAMQLQASRFRVLRQMISIRPPHFAQIRIKQMSILGKAVHVRLCVRELSVMEMRLERSRVGFAATLRPLENSVNSKSSITLVA